MAHPDVIEAAVIAKPDERWAERPLCCVVLREGSDAGRRRAARAPARARREMVAARRVRVHRGDSQDERRQVRQEGAARAARRRELQRRVTVLTPHAREPTARGLIDASTVATAARTHCLAPAALAALALPGCWLQCAAAPSSAPTKAQYVAKVDAICKASRVLKTAPLVKQLERCRDQHSLAGNEARAREASSGGRTSCTNTASPSLAQVRALAQPHGETAAIERFLSPLSERSQRGRPGRIFVALRPDRRGARAAGAGAGRRQQAEVAANAYGVRRAAPRSSCGRRAPAARAGPLGGAGGLATGLAARCR